MVTDCQRQENYSQQDDYNNSEQEVELYNINTCQMASSGQSLTTGMVKPAKIAFPGLGPKTVTFRVAGKKNGPDQ